MSRNHNFSTKPGDIKANKLVAEIKTISIQRGINFSYMCIEGLKLYKAQVLDKQGAPNER